MRSSTFEYAPESLASLLINYFSSDAFNVESVTRIKDILSKIKDAYTASYSFTSPYHYFVGNSAVADQVAKLSESIIYPDIESTNIKKILAFIKTSDWKQDSVAVEFISILLAVDDAEQQNIRQALIVNGAGFVKTLSFAPATQTHLQGSQSLYAPVNIGDMSFDNRELVVLPPPLFFCGGGGGFGGGGGPGSLLSPNGHEAGGGAGIGGYFPFPLTAFANMGGGTLRFNFGDMGNVVKLVDDDAKNVEANSVACDFRLDM